MSASSLMFEYFPASHQPKSRALRLAPVPPGSRRSLPFTGGALGVELSVKSIVSVLPSLETLYLLIPLQPCPSWRCDDVVIVVDLD